MLELGWRALSLSPASLLGVRRSFAAWKSDLRGANLARAGSVIVGIVLMHSIVDYPLRTSSIAAVFAVACALLVPYSPAARRRSAAEETGEAEGVRHLEAV